MPDVFQQTLEICNQRGLHARAAAKFVAMAAKFPAKITVKKDSLEVDGSSIMGLLLLAASPGEKIEIHASGEDAEKALKSLAELVESGFQENG